MEHDLGKRLRELRKAKGDALGYTLTQEAVANELNIRYATYNSWENNVTTPRSIEDWCKLADYFNVTIDFLMRGDYESIAYVSQREHKDKSLNWQLKTTRLTERQIKAVKVFELFAQGKSDSEIMDITKSDMNDIQNMLLDATRDGPVEIVDVKRDYELEDQLKKKYKNYPPLMDARIFSIGNTNPIFNKILVSWGAKEYLLEELSKPFGSRMLIGIAGGTTIANMFRFIKRGECPRISIYPLCVSPADVAIGVDPNTIIGDFAYRQQNYIDAFTMPYVSKETRDITSNAGEVPPEVLSARRMLGKAANVDMAFLGVGALDDVMSYMMTEFFRAASGITMEELREKAIGDILYHIIDKNARIVDKHYDDFLCSVELDVLRNMVLEGKRVVLVTHSGRKDISKVVVREHLVNVIIADDIMARDLIDNN